MDECAVFTRKELRIAAVEANLNWSSESYWECVAAAAALRKLLEGGKAAAMCGEFYLTVDVGDSFSLMTAATYGHPRFIFLISANTLSRM